MHRSAVGDERRLSRSARRRQEAQAIRQSERLIQSINRQLVKLKARFDRAGWPSTVVSIDKEGFLIIKVRIPTEMYFSKEKEPLPLIVTTKGELRLYNPVSGTYEKAKLSEIPISGLKYLQSDLLSINGPL